MGKGNLKVLIIENSIGFTGALRSIMAVTDVLSEEYGISFVYLIPSASANQQILEKSGYTVEKAPFIEIRKQIKTFLYPVGLIQNAIRLKKLVTKYQIDLVHINDLYNLVGIAGKRLGLKVPVIYHIRLLGGSYAGKLYRLWQGMLTDNADGLIAVSNAVARSWNTDRPGFEVIYDAIPPIYEKLPPPSEVKTTFRYNYLANYTRGKGQEYAIQALATAVKAGYTDLHIEFNGSDFGLAKNRQFQLELAQLARTLRVDQFVTFSGPVHDLQSHFRRFDGLLNFSLSESFSMVNLEAMHHGIPVISTDSGGPGEILTHGKTGLLVTVKNIEEMAGAMKLMAEDEALRHNLRTEAFEKTRKDLSISRTAFQLNSFYRKYI